MLGSLYLYLGEVTKASQEMKKVHGQLFFFCYEILFQGIVSV